MKRKAKPKANKTRPTGRGIACPECGGPTTPLYSKPEGAVTYRRRECSKCGKSKRFTTCERIVNRSTGQTITDKAPQPCL